MPSDAKVTSVFISPTMPGSTGNGLTMRMGMFAEGLARIGKLRVIVIPVAGGSIEASPLLRRLNATVDVVPIRGRRDRQFELISRIADPQARLRAFRAYKKPSMAAFLSPTVLAEIADLIESSQPDLVHIGRAYLTPASTAVPAHVPTTLDLDEADLDALRSQARAVRKQGAEWSAEWLEQEGIACDGLITNYGGRFARIFAASQREAAQLTNAHAQLDIDVIPNAVEIPPSAEPSDDGRTLLFLGSFGFDPNIHAAIDFCKHVLPIIRNGSKAGRSCRVLIAGANPPPSVQTLAAEPGVEVLGLVEDIGDLYRRTTLALAPLSAGGGTRIKLIEAAAHGVASIATPIGAEGLDWPVGAGGWIADMPEPFAYACLNALADPAECRRRALLGREIVRTRHNRAQLAVDIAQAMASIPTTENRP